MSFLSWMKWGLTQDPHPLVPSAPLQWHYVTIHFPLLFQPLSPSPVAEWEWEWCTPTTESFCFSFFFLHFYLPLTSIPSCIAVFIAFCCWQILFHTFFLSCCYKSGHTSSSQLEDCMFSYLLIYKFYIVHMGLFFCVAGLIKDVHTCVLCPHPAPGATVRTSHCSWMSELLFSSSYPG